MKKIILLSIVPLLTACTSDNPEIKFVNQSNVAIDSVTVSNSRDCPSLVFKNVLPEQNQTGELIFCEQLKRDGSYIVELYARGKLLQQKNFGYYTNGKSLNRSFVITFKDSLQIQSD